MIRKVMKKSKNLLLIACIVSLFVSSSVNAFSLEVDNLAIAGTASGGKQNTENSVEVTDKNDVSESEEVNAEVKEENPKIEETQPEQKEPEDKYEDTAAVDKESSGNQNSNSGNTKEDTTTDAEVAKVSITKAKIKLGDQKYYYDGTAKTPKVSVELDGIRLVQDSDYEVSYSNNVNPGIGKVVVKGIGKYEGMAKSSFSIRLGTTKITASTSTAVQVKIEWDEIAGVTRYDILRSTSEDKGYKNVGTVSVDAEKPLEFADKKVTFNEEYYYKVRGVYANNGTTVYGKGSEAKMQKVMVAKGEIKSVKKATPTALKVEWKEAENASGYIVYRCETEDGTFEKIGTVEGGTTVTYTDKNCACGRTYYYKVQAYRTWKGENCYGLISEMKSGYSYPNQVQIDSSSKYDLTSITLKWKAPGGAQGYEVFQSLKESEGYAMAAEYTSSNSLSYTEKGLDKNTTYYYKVRAYSKVDDKKVYGPFSKVYAKRPGGWRYENGYKLYYTETGKLVKDVSSIIGAQSSYEIKVNKKMNCVTVYAKDGDNGYIIPVKAFICSTGNSTPLGTYSTPNKFRWLELMGPCWGQWCTQIVGDYLFHSVYYDSYNNNNTLNVNAYNKLGTTASHGCIRLTAGDAKWIYDNCKLKTKVTIYNGDSAGPLGKPTAYKLQSWHTWDPTDPNMYSKCQSRGCH